LPHIIEAFDALSLGLGAGKRWEQHRRQNRDDGNDYQQFDQGESGQAFWLAADTFSARFGIPHSGKHFVHK